MRGMRPVLHRLRQAEVNHHVSSVQLQEAGAELSVATAQDGAQRHSEFVGGLEVEI